MCNVLLECKCLTYRNAYSNFEPSLTHAMWKCNLGFLRTLGTSPVDLAVLPTIITRPMLHTTVHSAKPLLSGWQSPTESEQTSKRPHEKYAKQHEANKPQKSNKQ
eukprot:525274-Amphidinium_carterae.1